MPERHRLRHTYPGSPFRQTCNNAIRRAGSGWQIGMHDARSPDEPGRCAFFIRR